MYNHWLIHLNTILQDTMIYIPYWNSGNRGEIKSILGISPNLLHNPVGSSQILCLLSDMDSLRIACNNDLVIDIFFVIYL